METTEISKVWIITNHKGEFLQVCATRNSAINLMAAWRENIERSGLFAEVSKIDDVYCDRITFDIKYRSGEIHTQTARETILF